MSLKNYLVNKMLLSWEKADDKKLSNQTLPEGIVEEKNICYANDDIRGHLLDIYYPAKVYDKRPVLIDIHGGGFMSSYKELNRLFGFHMASCGFLVFNINYRLALDKIKVRDQILDIATATNWIYDNIYKYNGDTNKVFLSGHSAGGVLATMEALNAKSPRLRRVFGISRTGFECYQGLLLDCGMMTFYQKTIGYWGMRSMVFDKGYLNQDTYKNMIWEQIPELLSLPKTFLISNEKDQLKYMTFRFKQILDKNKIMNKLDFQTNQALGHMAIIYNPETVACSRVIDKAIQFLMN